MSKSGPFKLALIIGQNLNPLACIVSDTKIIGHEIGASCISPATFRSKCQERKRKSSNIFDLQDHPLPWSSLHLVQQTPENIEWDQFNILTNFGPFWFKLQVWEGKLFHLVFDKRCGKTHFTSKISQNKPEQFVTVCSPIIFEHLLKSAKMWLIELAFWTYLVVMTIIIQFLKIRECQHFFQIKILFNENLSHQLVARGDCV